MSTPTNALTLLAAVSVIEQSRTLEEASNVYSAVRPLFVSDDPFVLAAAARVIRAFGEFLDADRGPVVPLVVFG